MVRNRGMRCVGAVALDGAAGGGGGFPEAGDGLVASAVLVEGDHADAGATDFFGEWDHVESDAVAILRTEAGRDPYDRQLTDLSENCPPAANGSAPSGPDTT